MKITIHSTPQAVGADAASFIAQRINEAIAKNGEARLLVSTGASQFEMFDALVQEQVDWSRVTMFHLDEYVALPETHIASFRKYLKERFVSRVPLGEAVYVDGEGDVQGNIAMLTRRICEKLVDVAVVGIGENAHVAFNDPPADFDTQGSYIVVNLDDRCKCQQVREGWFPAVADVPCQAISITVSQILKARCIVSVVPHAVKAEAVKNTLAQRVNNQVPATILKTHPDWNLYVDAGAASGFVW